MGEEYSLKLDQAQDLLSPRYQTSAHHTGKRSDKVFYDSQILYQQHWAEESANPEADIAPPQEEYTVIALDPTNRIKCPDRDLTSWFDPLVTTTSMEELCPLALDGGRMYENFLVACTFLDCFQTLAMLTRINLVLETETLVATATIMLIETQRCGSKMVSHRQIMHTQLDHP